jgi:nucleotide-binding universal stress UspA family protein
LEAVLKRIVVGIDGSEPSQLALRWAAEEAKLRGTPLHIVHSWEFPPMPQSIEALERAASRDLAESSHEVLAQAAASVAGAGLEITTELSNELPARALIGESKEAEMLVVGSRGRGGFKGLLLGSVSQQCANHAACPIVIVRPSLDTAPS